MTVVSPDGSFFPSACIAGAADDAELRYANDMCGIHGLLFSHPLRPVPTRVASWQATMTGTRRSGGEAASMIARG